MDNVHVGGEPGKENGIMELELKKRSQRHQGGGKSNRKCVWKRACCLAFSNGSALQSESSHLAQCWLMMILKGKFWFLKPQNSFARSWGKDRWRRLSCPLLFQVIQTYLLQDTCYLSPSTNKSLVNSVATQMRVLAPEHNINCTVLLLQLVCIANFTVNISILISFPWNY